MKRRLYIALTILVASLHVACDDVTFMEGTTSPQSPILESTAARSRLTTGGLESLYEIRWANGVPLEFERRVVSTDFEYLALGPLDDSIDVTSWSIAVENERTTLRAEVEGFETVVPLRIEQGVGTRICRVRVKADRMDASVPINTRSQVDPDAEDPTALSALGSPTVEFTRRRTELIGSCPPLETSTALNGELDSDILTYVDDASTKFALSIADISPSQELGLLDHDVELGHVTPFDIRAGTLTIFSQPAPESSRLNTNGYTLDFDMAVESSRARCAPPGTLNPADARSPAPIPASVLESTDADAAYALSIRTLSALAQNGVRAGLGCIGLEDGSISDESEDAVSTDDLDLERVGLGELKPGSLAVPVISFGEFPTVENVPGTNVIEIGWDKFVIDIYAEIQGVPVRILHLTTTFEFALQPALSRQGSLQLQIGSIEVESAEVTSRWRHEDAQVGDLKQWARRLIILLFEDRLQLPLPVEPGAPLELVTTQVRDDDLLLLLRIDSRL
ncbi:MAG: hypothetical protein ACQEVA_00835 [Myxococcota bacterium]